MKTTLLIFRHQLVENPNNIFYGVSQDLPISAEGQEKAKVSGAGLVGAGVFPSIIYASRLTRAQMTAEKIREGLGRNIPIETEEGLIDVSYPNFEGRSVDDQGQIDLGEGRIASLTHMDEYSAESPAEAGERFAISVRAIAERHPGELVGIVSHGDPIAWGLELMRNGDGADFDTKRLADRGGYPAKGDLAVLRLNQDGTLYGDVVFRPEIGQIPSIIEQVNSAKER